MIMTLVLIELCLGSDDKELELTFSFASNHRPSYMTTVIQINEKKKGFVLDFRKMSAIQLC